MKFAPHIVATLLLAASLASANSYLHVADSCYAARALRANGDKADAKNARIMKEAYRKAMEDSTVLERATEGYVKTLYFCFRFVAFEEKDRQIHLDSLMDASKSAYEKFPNNREIAHVYASTLSMWGSERNTLSSLKEGVAGKVRDVATAAEDWQILGRAHFLLPYVPLILSWPDEKLADKYLTMALEKNRKDIYNYYFLADLRYDQKRYDDAMELIVQGLDEGVRPGYILEDKRARWHLKELWKIIDRKHKDKLSPKHLEDGEKIRKEIEAMRNANKKKK
jgi:tetratricopeptide (TPR) repeat protein